MGSLSLERILVFEQRQHESLYFESGGGGRHWGRQALDCGSGGCRRAGEERHRWRSPSQHWCHHQCCRGWGYSRGSYSCVLSSTCSPPPRLLWKERGRG